MRICQFLIKQFNDEEILSILIENNRFLMFSNLRAFIQWFELF